MKNRTKLIMGSAAVLLASSGLLAASKSRRDNEVANYYTTLGAEINIGSGDGTQQFARLNAWDPKFYVEEFKKPGARMFNYANAAKYAQQIYNAKHGYGWLGYEDEDTVFDAFRQMGSLINLSRVSAEFSKIYKTDMQRYVTETLLNTAEVDELMKIIQKFK